MKTIFNDFFRSNSQQRKDNIQTLKDNGFATGGLYCLSGQMHILNLKTKTVQVFFLFQKNLNLKMKH